MGLDRCFIRFLFAAKAAGVDFHHMVTIGRQVFTDDVDQRWLEHILLDHRVQENAHSLLGDPGRYSEKFWPVLGAKEIDSLDASDFEKASIVHDLNHPIPCHLNEKFSAVVDGGVIEHVFNASQAIKNCMEMVQLGGHYMCVTVANSLLGHGFYQFSPEWAFRVFSEANGFELKSVLLSEVGIPDPRYYKVDDPAGVGGRVELATSLPIYMLVLARRIRIVPIFEHIPQQSDYVSQWQANDGGGQQLSNTEMSIETKRGAPIPSGKSRKLPSFLKWDSPLRKGLRQAGRTLKKLATRTIPHIWNQSKKIVRSTRGVTVANDKGLNARYFHRLSYDDLKQGRIFDHRQSE